MEKIIRLTESDLHNIVKESVNRILREGFMDKFKKKKHDKELDDIDDFYKNCDSLGLKHSKDPETEKFNHTCDKMGLKRTKK